MEYALRFWNKANECIRVGGKYEHVFDTSEDVFNAATALLPSAVKNGAVEIDVNNVFYDIIE